MRKDKNEAILLRKEGRSYKQIQETLGVAKSTLSLWLKDIELSEAAKQKIARRVHDTSIKALVTRNKQQTVLAKERAKRIQKEAIREAISLQKDPLFLIGVSLYWAEGYKRGANGSKWKCVDFTNSDPEMVKVMMGFFRKFCKVSDDRIRIQLIAHPNIDIGQAVAFWSELTLIPGNQFIRTYCKISRASQGKRPAITLTHGTVHIRIHDVQLFFRIIGWIKGLRLISEEHSGTVAQR
jgi:hypothetical protein